MGREKAFSEVLMLAILPRRPCFFQELLFYGFVSLYSAFATVSLKAVNTVWMPLHRCMHLGHTQASQASLGFAQFFFRKAF